MNTANSVVEESVTSSVIEESKVVDSSNQEGSMEELVSDNEKNRYRRLI